MSSFTVMTWNVENLFRPGETDAAADPVAFSQKLTLIANTIKKAAPDVLALQEVGGKEPLFDLQQELVSVGAPYPHRALSSFPDGRGIRVAFLSKLAIVDQSEMVDFPGGPALDIHDLDANGVSVPVIRMSRGALRIRMSVTWTWSRHTLSRSCCRFVDRGAAASQRGTKRSALTSLASL